MVVRASVYQSVDLGLISQVESYQKISKHGIQSFPDKRLAQKESCGEQASKLAGYVLAGAYPGGGALGPRPR